MAFIDKINPDVSEGRLLIRNGDYVLKDPEADVSSIPLLAAPKAKYIEQ